MRSRISLIADMSPPSARVMSLFTISARVGAVWPSSPSASRRSAALIAARIGLPALPPSGGVSWSVMVTSSWLVR
jgi:hypothetical protein